MGLAGALASPLRKVATSFLAPASICSIWSLAAALVLALGWLALRRRRRGRRIRAGALMRALFARRVLLHRSTRADLVYCVLSLATFGAVLGWAVVSTSWIGDGVASFLAGRFGERAPEAPTVALIAARTVVLFLAYDLGFFVDHTLKHKIPALWELHKTHHSAEALTPLVNFRVHPLDSLILANTLSLFIGIAGGAATWLFGRRTTSFLLFDDNVLMVLYIYLTAQLQHTQIWIPFTGTWGRLFMSPAHHQLHHSSDPAHFNCNMGASLALWDWLFGSLRLPSAQSPRLKYGASGFAHDPHGAIGLIVEPAAKALAALARMIAPRAAGAALGERRSTSAGP
ncbi:MAG TPA: sterol desaturase family protein [Roseiarcus sp.]|jgi:sterol desaturase/sphingolipid hydroxylase (fatty acid hydroxylase superfamily)|nr:sterol desaturase family protein [Roseiarcus sp.]